jgi:hypothetical protein
MAAVSSGVNGIGVKETSGISTSTLKVHAGIMKATSIREANIFFILNPIRSYCLLTFPAFPKFQFTTPFGKP